MKLVFKVQARWLKYAWFPEPRFSRIQPAINYADYKIVTNCTGHPSVPSVGIHQHTLHPSMHPSIHTIPYIHSYLHLHLCTFYIYMCITLHCITLHTLCISIVYMFIEWPLSPSPPLALYKGIYSFFFTTSSWDDWTTIFIIGGRQDCRSDCFGPVVRQICDACRAVLCIQERGTDAGAPGSGGSGG